MTRRCNLINLLASAADQSTRTADARPIRDRGDEFTISLPKRVLEEEFLVDRYSGELIADRIEGTPETLVTEEEVVVAFRFPRPDVLQKREGEIPDEVSLDDLEDDLVLAD